MGGVGVAGVRPAGRSRRDLSRARRIRVVEPGPAGLKHLTELEEGAGTVRLRRVGEPLQTDVELLAALSAAQVVPGAVITYETNAHGRVLVRGAEYDGPAVDVLVGVASLLFVTPEG